jgi:acyl-CoA thioesterase-1
MGYTLPTRATLAGKVNVHRPPTNCGSTLSGIQNIDTWLGDGHWDVIHFNWGMHDLKYLQNGKQNVPPAEYEKNLRILVARLQKTGATLIFATTTPIPEKTIGIFKRNQEDVKKYNDIAVKVMKDNGVMIDDLYAFALPKMAEIQAPNDVHQTKQGSQIISRQVAASILEALGKRPAQMVSPKTNEPSSMP